MLLAVGEYPVSEESKDNLVKAKQIMICNTDKSTYTTFKFTPQSNLNYKGTLKLHQQEEIIKQGI